MAYGKRSFWESPWHYCSRCDEKTHISVMTWQRGKLLCNKRCLDTLLLGEREEVIAEVLGDGKQEYAPVPKLREPDITTADEGYIGL